MKKPDIVLLHGWNLSGEKFAPLTDALVSRGYRVFAPDFPGFGKEPSPKRAWHVVDYAEYFEEYCKKHAINNPVLIGHSFGGRVALKFTHIYPERARMLILSGTPGFSPVKPKKLLLFFILAKIGRLLFAIPPLSFFSDWAKRWLYYVAGSKEFFKAEGTMKDTFKNVVKDDLVPAMESIKIPTLLLWGEYDLMVPVSIAQRMKQVIYKSELIVIPESDHGVPYKMPDEFATYVVNFLTRS